jgi:hypothetical protein
MVIYTFSEKERDRVRSKMDEIRKKEEINCGVNLRRAGRYWQDMFPELFGKEIKNYKPFYRNELIFRKLADKAKNQEEIEDLEKQIFDINTKEHLAWLNNLDSIIKTLRK